MFAENLLHVADDLGDAQQILVGLGGQAHHKVQLHAVVAGGKGHPAGFQQVFLPQVFVDDVPQALRTRFGSEGQAAFPHLLDALRQVQVKGVGAHGGQRQVDVHGLQSAHQALAQRLQVGIVAGAETGQGHLVPAGGGNEGLGLLFQRLRLFGADGPVGIARLAKPASPAAAAEQLDHGPVKDDVRRGHHEFVGIIGLVQILYHALTHYGRRAVFWRDGGDGPVFMIGDIIQRGHINAADLRGLAQEFFLALAVVTAPAVKLQQLRHDLLALADGDKVEEVRHRLRIVDAGAAGDDQRLQACPLGGAKGHPGQVQHIEHPGIIHLVLERKAQDIKRPYRIAAFQRVQWLAAHPHLLFHIQKGRIGPFAPDALHAVQQTVEDLGAQMGHPDLINIGETKSKAQVHLAFVLIDRVVLAAGIARGLAHMFQTGADGIVHNCLPNRNLNFYFISYLSQCKAFFGKVRKRMTTPAAIRVRFPLFPSRTTPAAASRHPTPALTPQAIRSPQRGKRASSAAFSTRPPSSGRAGSRLNAASTTWHPVNRYNHPEGHRPTAVAHRHAHKALEAGPASARATSCPYDRLWPL